MIRKYIAVAVFLLSAAVMAAALLHAGRYASLCFVARTPAASTAAKGDGVPEAAATEVRGTAVPGSVDSGGALSGAAPVRGERSDAAASAPQGVR